MNVPVGKSTIISWTVMVLAAIGSVVEGIQNGLSWEAIALAVLAAITAWITQLDRGAQARQQVRTGGLPSTIVD